MTARMKMKVHPKYRHRHVWTEDDAGSWSTLGVTSAETWRMNLSCNPSVLSGLHQLVALVMMNHGSLDQCWHHHNHHDHNYDHNNYHDNNHNHNFNNNNNFNNHNNGYRLKSCNSDNEVVPSVIRWKNSSGM